MSQQVQRLAELTAAYVARQQQAELLWAELKQDLINQPKVMRKYCACLMLCAWLKRKIKEMA